MEVETGFMDDVLVCSSLQQNGDSLAGHDSIHLASITTQLRYFSRLPRLLKRPGSYQALILLLLVSLFIISSQFFNDPFSSPTASKALDSLSSIIRQIFLDYPSESIEHSPLYTLVDLYTVVFACTSFIVL